MPGASSPFRMLSNQSVHSTTVDSPCDPVVSDDAVDGGVGVVDGKSETDAPTPCGAIDDEVDAADVKDVVFGDRSVNFPAVANECGVTRG